MLVYTLAMPAVCQWLQWWWYTGDGLLTILPTQKCWWRTTSHQKSTVCMTHAITVPLTMRVMIPHVCLSSVVTVWQSLFTLQIQHTTLKHWRFHSKWVFSKLLVREPQSKFLHLYYRSISGCKLARSKRDVAVSSLEVSAKRLLARSKLDAAVSAK